MSDSSRRAILLMLLAVGLFALMDGGMKWLGADYPPLQVAALRGAVGYRDGHGKHCNRKGGEDELRGRKREAGRLGLRRGA